jgi:DNA-binding XRE family transcriptional regulator
MKSPSPLRMAVMAVVEARRGAATLSPFTEREVLACAQDIALESVRAYLTILTAQGALLQRQGLTDLLYQRGPQYQHWARRVSWSNGSPNSRRDRQLRQARDVLDMVSSRSRQEVAKRIREARETAGWSLPRMAALCGMRKQNYYKIEASERPCPVDVLAIIAAACGVNVDDLVPSQLWREAAIQIVASQQEESDGGRAA